MSQHPSLKSKGKEKAHRSVWKRFERLKFLSEKDKWSEKDSVYGLEKIKLLKLKIKKEKAAAAAGELRSGDRLNSSSQSDRLMSCPEARISHKASARSRTLRRYACKADEEVMLSFDDFKKLEIITAKVEDVREHPDAERLLILAIDTGSAKKEIVAGIKNYYSKESLVGKNIVIINNLEPAVIRGVLSSAMLLAAQTEDGISILVPDKPVKPGSKVK